jgi:hypothetical protein
MRAFAFRTVTAVLAVAALGAAPLRAQRALGVGAEYLGYSFDSGLEVSAAQLFLVPVALRLPVGQAVTFDLYSAWASGQIEKDNLKYTLEGPTDTRMKLSWQATPWALVGVSATLPTGDASHTNAEALVAAALATDILGFKEATWGTGSRVTTSVATAMRAGSFGVGLAASYSVNGEFQPQSGENLKYQPGNETRVRIGVDRNIGSSTLTMGATFMTYAEDQARQDGNATWENLFQAGNRMRFDAAYAFRAGAGVWTLYAADLWREHGDITLTAFQGTETPSQNLLIGGMMGTIGIGAYQFRPMVDMKLQSRKAQDGSTADSGWMLGAGGDFPVRLFGAYDFFPKARVLFGAIKDPTGVGRSLLGGEFSGTIRWGF